MRQSGCCALLAPCRAPGVSPSSPPRIIVAPQPPGAAVERGGPKQGLGAMGLGKEGAGRWDFAPPWGQSPSCPHGTGSAAWQGKSVRGGGRCCGRGGVWLSGYVAGWCRDHASRRCPLPRERHGAVVSPAVPEGGRKQEAASSSSPSSSSPAATPRTTWGCLTPRGDVVTPSLSPPAGPLGLGWWHWGWRWPSCRRAVGKRNRGGALSSVL